MKNTSGKLIRNAKGQVAIFVALIFQVLFVFFAMVVNVGLLVHHKINLQNSVDFAAYYGAMKQAEMLNAIAHVNYQIRQSYKLLTFRYEQLGSGGLSGAGSNQPNWHPYSSADKKIIREGDDPVPFESAFCIPYTPVDIVAGRSNSENYCKQLSSLKVPLPGVPSFGGSPTFTPFVAGITAFANQMVAESQKFCRYAMAMNWIQMTKFIAAYKMDIRNRKKLLLALANELSQGDPKDIDGDLIKEGVYKTFYRNLSIPNREGFSKSFSASQSNGFDFKYVNSFSVGDCRGNPSDIAPPAWLKEIYIFPMFAVFDGSCSGNTMIEFKAGYLNNGAQPYISPNIPPQLQQFAQDLATTASEFPSSDPNQLLNRASIGFEKNPYCVGYYGVSATATPKIPFSPFGAVKLKAVAYAKPFGGRIGPWYGTTWDQGADQSNDADRTDKLLPVRVLPNQIITPSSAADLQKLRDDKRLFPNHSRYLGDKWGVVTDLTMSQFGKAIHERVASIHLDWYNHIFDQDFDVKNGFAGDILAWDKANNQSVPLRDLEIEAVAPDQFDTSEYSIDPDFYNNYLKRIEKGIGKNYSFMLRGDLGSRMDGDEASRRYSVRNQIEAFKDNTKAMVDIETKLGYYLNQFGQLLTSWQQRSPDEYVLDVDRFGRCQTDSTDPIKQDGKESAFTMGSCKVGGRTGYSVKLVDGKFLKNEVNGTVQDYELGGSGKSGSIKNPPPSF